MYAYSHHSLEYLNSCDHRPLLPVSTCQQQPTDPQALLSGTSIGILWFVNL